MYLWFASFNIRILCDVREDLWIYQQGCWRHPRTTYINECYGTFTMKEHVLVLSCIVRKKYSDKGSIDCGPHPHPKHPTAYLFTRNSRCSPGNTLRFGSTCINRMFNDIRKCMARKHEDLISIMVFHQELRTLFGNKLDRISWLPHRHEETPQKIGQWLIIIMLYNVI